MHGAMLETARDCQTLYILNAKPAVQAWVHMCNGGMQSQLSVVLVMQAHSLCKVMQSCPCHDGF